MANYFDDAQNKGEYNGQTFYDKNKWLQASGYQKQGGGGDIRPYTGSYSQPGGYEDIVAKQIAMQQKANEPIINQLESEKEPLKQRYSQLIDQIKGNQKTAEDRQTQTTNNELGRRGLSASTDGLAQQDMTNALNPITQNYTNMIQDTGYNSEKALRDVASQIAQLQSGAISQGTNTGMALYQEDQNRLLQQQATERQAEQARQAQAAADRQYSTIDLPQSQAAIQNIMSTINNRGSSGGGDESAALAKIFGMDTSVWNNGAPMSSQKKPLSSYNY